ncbi:YrdB family protein [Streptomyces sp. TRM68416]|nr:YrdB family protein [Streptomyces sp. TRM68416]
MALPRCRGLRVGFLHRAGRPSKGESDVRTPGPLRPLLELAVFFGAVAAFYLADLCRAARWLLVIMVGYQVLAYDRIGRLLTH